MSSAVPAANCVCSRRVGSVRLRRHALAFRHAVIHGPDRLKYLARSVVVAVMVGVHEDQHFLRALDLVAGGQHAGRRAGFVDQAERDQRLDFQLRGEAGRVEQCPVFRIFWFLFHRVRFRPVGKSGRPAGERAGDVASAGTFAIMAVIFGCSPAVIIACWPPWLVPITRSVLPSQSGAATGIRPPDSTRNSIRRK